MRFETTLGLLPERRREEEEREREIERERERGEGEREREREREGGIERGKIGAKIEPDRNRDNVSFHLHNPQFLLDRTNTDPHFPNESHIHTHTDTHTHTHTHTQTLRSPPLQVHSR